MLNPSTADETTDDPTIRRVIDFSRRWGFSRLIVVKLVPLRSTDPKAALAWAKKGAFLHLDEQGRFSCLSPMPPSTLTKRSWHGDQAAFAVT